MRQQLVGRALKHPKTDSRYWKDRVYLDGKSYMVRIHYRGQRSGFSLRTANKNVAGNRAKEIYCQLVAQGWTAVLEEHRPGTIKRKKVPTFRSWIETVKTVSNLRESTMTAYEGALTRLVTEVFGPDGLSKKINQLSAPKIEAWRKNRIASGEDRKAATTTVQAVLRNSRALFSRRLVKLLSQTYEIVDPFAEIELGRKTNNKFRLTFDPAEVLSKAQVELDLEVFKILVLGGCLGLRRSEIDALEWSMVDLHSGTLTLRETKWMRPKTEDSSEPLPLEPGLIGLLMEWQTVTKGAFVVASRSEPRLPKGGKSYRCQVQMEVGNAWLRKNGVDVQKPLHTLRKAFGSLICQQSGIYAASRALRHTSVQVTESYYTDAKAVFTAGLGDILASDKRVNIHGKAP
jgi:integrase